MSVLEVKFQKIFHHTSSSSLTNIVRVIYPLGEVVLAATVRTHFKDVIKGRGMHLCSIVYVKSVLDQVLLRNLIQTRVQYRLWSALVYIKLHFQSGRWPEFS